MKKYLEKNLSFTRPPEAPLKVCPENSLILALKSPKPDKGPRGLPYLEGILLTATGAFHGLQHIRRYAHII